MISYVMSCREQDCVVVLAPYPNNPNPVESFNVKTDFDLTGDGLVWYARGSAPSTRHATCACPASTSARRPAIGVLFTPPPTRSGIGATAAGSTR